MRTLLLAILLIAFWLGLSGQFDVLLLAFGALSIGFALFLSNRMKTADTEGLPLHYFPGVLVYWGWLLIEMLKSCWKVSLLVIDPRQPVSPTLTVIKTRQKTEVGRATFGNSITLTPGTITVKTEGDKLLVHALTRDNADDVESGDMDRRVARVEGGA
ncbi:MAG: Na+/H+ antiporter subunit E [Hyphomicrobiaceae bacterium]